MICLRAINPSDPSALPHAFWLLPDLIVGHEELPKMVGLPVFRVYWALPGGSVVMQTVVADTFEDLAQKVKAAREVGG